MVRVRVTSPLDGTEHRHLPGEVLQLPEGHPLLGTAMHVARLDADTKILNCPCGRSFIAGPPEDKQLYLRGHWQREECETGQKRAAQAAEAEAKARADAEAKRKDPNPNPDAKAS